MTPFADWEDQRIVTAKRVEEAVLGFHDSLIRASKTREKVALLMDVDHRLEHLTAYNRFAVQLKILSFRHTRIWQVNWEGCSVAGSVAEPVD